MAGTQVVVDIDDSGNYLTRNIEDIRVGDWVLSKDQLDPDAPLTQQVVTDTFQTTAYRTWTVQIRDDETGELETVTTTDEHPFYVEGQGWTAAQDLAEGATLSNPDGTTATVVALETTLYGEGLTVYNFAVDTTHTYFVADDQGDVNAVWVHNTCITTNGPIGRARQDRAMKRLRARFGSANVQPEQYLRDASGKIIRVGGLPGRRLDAVVIKNGVAQHLVEITSKTARKAGQILREKLIRATGNIYVRDRTTRKLVEVTHLVTKTIRLR